MEKKFNALVIKEQDGLFVKSIEERDITSLPKHSVLIRVKYSSLNYKDALSASGNKGVTKSFPHTPGIDAAGIIVQSLSQSLKEGDEVIVTGYDLGMNTSGGLAEYISVPEEWVIPKPKNMSLFESMIIGTAGFTVGIGIKKLMNNNQSKEGEFVVTGSTGGVGTLAVAILSKLDFNVVAATGKKDMHDFLIAAGAKRIVGREEVLDTTGKPLVRPLWSGGFDTLGGEYLESILKATSKEGCVVSTGLAFSPSLKTTVIPFILNGINLLGVNSADYLKELRLQIWENISTNWKPSSLQSLSSTIELHQVPAYLESMIKGGAKGRVVVKI